MTLAFNHLGRLGQLGNQMFQYSALKGIATKNGYEYMIPKHDVFVDAFGNKLRTELFDLFDINVNTGLFDVSKDRYLQEPHFEYSKEFVNNCPDNISIVGFFQSEKYFAHIKDEIKKDFIIKKHIRNECANIINNVFDNPIALHIRRCDFLMNSGNHYNLTLDYYEQALKKYDSNRQVIIFSDDSQWCKKQKLFDHERFIVSEDNGPYHDLYLMTQCNDFIIANSSFSWWGAWLANRGKVIAPKRWFGPNNSHLETKDLYCKTWEIL